ncbi:mannose-1-phosphate guanylyltransferase [Bacillus sp. SLBN-46]|uniref:sugar phosphate nucleotidyltransferase n=1 Tax=Bacillus sp. SLBN-46 TaxID=3042283 RepID=UPI00285757EA|nr:sugar phosphate nucleotidyltransferase [Bacillus sp. SLBN-46]MDR6123333.1 mannose-1-phosphate guanylyltransferase [Bacillus sp. SLBN-46]
MKILLLSGGSGKRLWPLSNQVRSKQFLKLLIDENGIYESMIQRVCRQIESVGLLPSTYLVTCQNQLEIIRNQIGDEIKILCEPVQRGTFPSISLACTFFHTNLHVNPDETICVLPVDSLVDITFYQLLKKIPDFINQSDANLALLGVPPQLPSNQFGYIVPVIKNKESFYPISQFIEKPDCTEAKNLLEKNALWNCGVFAFPLKFILSYLKSNGLPTDYNEMLDIYKNLTKNSFDYEVVEKSTGSIVIPYNGLWKDLGSWTAITEQLKNKVIGKGEISEDSTETYIVNELPLPIHVIGISDSIIVAGHDGILISDKNKSENIKRIIKNTLPMYEEKRWGDYRILSRSTTEEGMESQTKLIKVAPGKNMSYQTHNLRQETWTVISGTGEFILDDQLFSIYAGDVLIIPVGAKHGVKAITPLEIIEVQLGTKIDEEDIIRLTDSWEVAVKRCK